MRRVVFLVWLILGLGGCAVTAGGDREIATLEAVAPAVVSIADREQTLASGFFITTDLIVTNQHVLQREPLFVVDDGGKRHVLERVFGDQDSDIAVLRSSRFVAPAVLVLVDQLPPVGTPVYALGNPFGAGITTTAGIISALPRAIGKQHLMQTDAAINPGNSGGPLIDRQGRVVGVVTSRGAIGSGIGFVVPAPQVALLIEPVRFPQP